MIKRVKYIVRRLIPQRLHPYLYRTYSWLALYFTMRNFIKSEMNKLRSSDDVKLLLSQPTIQIIQPTFYDFDGSVYLSGGAERYLCDLAKIIIELGYKPFIVQQGNKFWHKKHLDLVDVFGVPAVDIFGIPLDGFVQLNKLAHDDSFGKPKLRIYSNFIVAYPHTEPNAIGIGHGMFWSSHPKLYSILPIEKAFKNLNTFVAVDKATISWFRGIMPEEMLSGKKLVRYIPNYVDLKKFFPSSSAGEPKVIKILHPRRLYDVCGYFLIEKIIPYILNKYSYVEFHFVGQADLRATEAVTKIINTFPDKVFWHFEDAENMHEIYKHSDITLIPTTINEGTSLSCLEAMATGNAIIASNVGGLSDLLIDNYNGLLINPPNTLELQEAVERLINDKNLRQRLGNNAVQVAQSFDKKSWKKKWINIINQSIEKT